MNEELKNELSKLMLDGVDFLKGEIPEYVSQLLVWHGVYSFVQFIVGISFILLMLWAVYKFFPRRDKDEDGGYKDNWALDCDGDYNQYIVLLSIYVLLFITIGIIAIIAYINLDWLQIIIAPKVWIVEYITKLGS